MKNKKSISLQMYYFVNQDINYAANQRFLWYIDMVKL